MTRDYIIHMAQEAGFVLYDMHDVNGQDLGESVEADDFKALERFFNAAYAAGAKDEREACAKVCEAEGKRVDASWVGCAAAIRARGEK
ncbi:hypothetical protein UFOVP835_17 [uncultured Caudovirales phage]|uniref:Uncharacterized protein n=1 Tax=uncultured Caudovirales phage TaxID=2100421 RepID=A0A6J5P800_9CAUD|nr:hypothetical protein UFOVP835_17 [uncultured Caudovirales phage]